MNNYNNLKMNIEIYKNNKQINTMLITDQTEILIKLASEYKKKANKKGISFNYEYGKDGGFVNKLTIIETQTQYIYNVDLTTIDKIDEWTYKYIISEEDGDKRHLIYDLYYNE